MEAAENKCVIVADEELPAGVLANTAAILGMTLGKCLPACVDEDVPDGSGYIHRGITNIPIPILKSSREAIRSLREKLFSVQYEDILVVDFSDLAQTSPVYSNYMARARASAESDFTYLGIAIYGDKKRVNSLTGSLPLFR